MHPDFGQVVQDSGFQEWIGNSKIRTELFKRADAFDVDAADELLSTYKTLHVKKATQETEADKAIRSQAIRTVSVDGGGSGEVTKKVYRRSDLIRLKMRDPAKYDELADSGELARAYQENRVR